MEFAINESSKMDEISFATRLSMLDSCAISDALDSLGLAGAATGLARLTTDTRIAGSVLTVKLAAGNPPEGSSQHLATRAIEAANPGDVIVIEQSTGIDAAGWGGVLSNAAQTRKIAGVIVEGPARDIDEAAALDFPVFARKATCITARGRVYEQAFNMPVTVGGIEVSPRDYVIADASGVVFIANDRVEEVITAAEKLAAREELMTRDVRAGHPVGAVMGVDYETMLERSR